MVSILGALTNVEYVRELTAFLKAIEFVAIPLVQILTSSELLKVLVAKKNSWES